jgi:hypothetical protein
MKVTQQTGLHWKRQLGRIKSRTANSHLAKAGDYGNDTLGSSLKFLLHLIDLCFKIPAFAKWRNVNDNPRQTTKTSYFKIETMKKTKELILIVVLVLASTFIASLTIKLFLDNEASLFVLHYFLVGLSLPLIQLFFENDVTRKRLIISSVLYPMIMILISYLT